MESVPVSTKTIIATSNVQFDIVKVFQELPFELLGDHESIRIKLMYYQNQTRGDDSFLKKKNKKCFRNAVNVVLQVEPSKHINFKLSKNGKFQLTGCRNEDHAIRTVIFMITLIGKKCPSGMIMAHMSQKIQVYFQTVMTNIDFSLGFCVDRKKLDSLLNQDTPFHSLLETSFGYTGVNIKFPLDISWWKLKVPVLTCHVNDLENWKYSHEPFDEVNVMSQEMIRKKKYNTFLVFHSGNVIMSGMTKETMKDHYETFIQMITEWRPHIEEKIAV